MKRFLKFILCLSIVSLFLAGCQGCFDGEITRKVDYPHVKVAKDTNYDITFTSATKGASFRYTLDGSDPEKSKTAVVGDSLTISFLDEVKVYAFKDGMRNSEVIYYRIPTTNAIREVNYKADHFVDTHWYKADDVFGRQKIEICYNGKGSDDQWFSDDDAVKEYTVFNYDGANLEESVHYIGAGGDGEWMTKDDESDMRSDFTVDELGRKSTESIKNKDGAETSSKTYTWYGEGENLNKVVSSDGKSTVYTYTDDILSQEDQYEGETITTTIKYTITDGVVESATVTSGGTQIGYMDFTNSYELNKRYKNVTQADGNKIKYLGYGEDTDVGVTKYEYSGDKVSVEHVYADKAGEFEVKFTNFTYEGENLVEEEIHERYWRDEYYNWDWHIIIKKYFYNDDNTIAKVEYYNDEKFKSQYDVYTYATGFKYISTFERPELPKKTITVDLTLTAEGTIKGGSYTMEGKSFDVDGNLTVEDLGFPKEKTDFLKAAKKKIAAIVEETEIDAQGMTINGKVAGAVRIEGDVSQKDNKSYLKVWFYFEDYDDGDMMIDGELLSEFEGKFDLSGKISGRGEGYIQGDVIVEDGDPQWTDEEYSQITYTVVTLDANSDPALEWVYNSAGADTKWELVDDNTTSQIVKYTPVGSVVTKSIYTKAGSDDLWNTADDIENERFVTEYSGESVVKEEYWSIYGTYSRTYNGAGADGDWTTIDDNVLEKAQLKYDTWCHWDYSFGWSWDYL